MNGSYEAALLPPVYQDCPAALCPTRLSHHLLIIAALVGITACKRYQGTRCNVLGGTQFHTANSMIDVDCHALIARVGRVCAIARYGDAYLCLCKVHADTLQLFKSAAQLARI